jgi:hypothetical protein
MSLEQSIKAKVSARTFVGRRLADGEGPIWSAPLLGAAGSVICFFAVAVWFELRYAGMAAFTRLMPSETSSTLAGMVGAGSAHFREGAQSLSVRQ